MHVVPHCKNVLHMQQRLSERSLLLSLPEPPWLLAGSVLSLRSGRASGTLARFPWLRWTFCSEKPVCKSTRCTSILSLGESYFCLSSSETGFHNMGGRDQEAGPGSQCRQLRREQITATPSATAATAPVKNRPVRASCTGVSFPGISLLPFRNGVGCHGY